MDGGWKLGSPYGLDKREILTNDGSHLVATVVVKRAFVSHVTGRTVFEEEPIRVRRASLIAAAPDILEALKRLVSDHQQDMPLGRAMDDAATLIAKVEGE